MPHQLKIDRNIRLIEDLQGEQKQLENEGKRLKWFLVLAITTWPLGLLWKSWLAVSIFLAWMCFYLVGNYISFFHRRECARRLDEARIARNTRVELDDANR